MFSIMFRFVASAFFGVMSLMWFLATIGFFSWADWVKPQLGSTISVFAAVMVGILAYLIFSGARKDLILEKC